MHQASAQQQGAFSTKMWVCPKCGYVHDGPEPPEKCPICGTAGNLFTLVE